MQSALNQPNKEEELQQEFNLEKGVEKHKTNTIPAEMLLVGTK